MEYCRGVLDRISRMDRVLLVGDVVVILGFLVQSSVILTAGLALVVVGFARVVLRRRRR